MSKFDLHHVRISANMMKKRTSSDVIPAIILVIILFILGVCLFLLLQHVPMKQMMYSFSANETKQVKQATPVIQSKQAAQVTHPIQTVQKKAMQQHATVPIHVTTSEERVIQLTPVRDKIIPMYITPTQQKTTVKLTPVRDRLTFTPVTVNHITPAPIKLTRIRKRRIPNKRIRKMHYVEITPERRS